jgi:alkylation response protein AidB-like acyl-CoA dehydrogenase
MFVELEQLRSAAIYAACMLAEPDARARTKAMAAVKIVTGKAARFIGQQAVQLHGGMGVTDEYAVGHYFLRLTADGLLFGDADDHVRALAAAGGFVGADPYWAGCEISDKPKLPAMNG